MTTDQNIQLVTAMREIIRRAVITLAVLRDPDKRFLGLSQLPQHVVHDVKEAYGYSSVSVREFQPTALEISQMEVVLPWLVWLRRDHGDIEARRFIGWAMGVGRAGALLAGDGHGAHRTHIGSPGLFLAAAGKQCRRREQRRGGGHEGDASARHRRRVGGTGEVRMQVRRVHRRHDTLSVNN